MNNEPKHPMCRWVSTICFYSGTAIGGFAVLRSIFPNAFATSGDEHMALAIVIFILGCASMVIGGVAALFTGVEKWKHLGLNSVFLVLWFLAELVRVSHYGK